MASHQITEMMEEAYSNRTADVSYMDKYKKEQIGSVDKIESEDPDGGNPSRIFKNTQELLKETTCSNEKLYKYLKSNDDYFKTSYAEEYMSTGKWPDNIQIPKSSDVLTSKGSIDWSQVPDSGYVLDSGGKAVKETYFPKKGEIIDRYGPSDGTFTSPVIDGKPYSYDNRSLPYIDDLISYKGEIAPGFGSSGGGIQYQLPLPVDILEELGFLKMIK